MPQGDFAAKIEAFRRQIVDMQRAAPADPGGEFSAATEELHTALEELHIAEEELTHRNTELLTIQRTLEEERTRYRELFEFAPDGYLITDGAGTIREANRAASMMLRARSDLLTGQ